MTFQPLRLAPRRADFKLRERPPGTPIVFVRGMRALRILIAVACLGLVSPALLAQVDYQPTPVPVTYAVDRDWYRDGAPIPFAGDLYYPTGPTVYFNGYSMVASGEYDGVTLYSDTTIEPYSVVFVPVTGRILRPYVRMRGVDQPTGSTGIGDPGAPEPRGWEGRHDAPRQLDEEAEARALQRRPFEERPDAYRLETVRRPEGNLGIWLSFQGHRWQQVGPAVMLDAGRMTLVGEYSGFSVYADVKEPYVIYIPSRAGLVAPFRRVTSE